MNKLFPFALLVYGVVASGCATYQKSSSDRLDSFKSGNSSPAIDYYEKNQSDKDKQLHMVEAGRLNMLEGNFQHSYQEFNKAIDEIFDLQEGAMIRLKDTGGTALSSTFLDDRVSPYNLPSFEAVLTFQYQALNFIFMGDIDAAAVELRRAVSAQDIIAEKYEKQVEKAKAEADERAADSMNSIDQYYATMGPVLGQAKSGFQNPYVWYFSGLMYELQRDPGNAYIAYKKAWELSPDNRSLQRDLVRLSRTENPEEHAAFQSRFNMDNASRDRASAEIVVIYEEGLISQRYSERIPIFVINGYQNITFPVYRDTVYQPGHLRVFWNNLDAGELMPLCYVQSLAYHDLKERIRGIAARNVSRFITREATKAIGRRSDNSSVKLITLAAAGIASLADQADTRGWYSLPMVVQMFRASFEAGEQTLTLDNGEGRKLEIPVTLAQGETKLVWIADLGSRVSSCVASLTHAQKMPAQFAKSVGGLAYTSTPVVAQGSPLHQPSPGKASTSTSAAAAARPESKVSARQTPPMTDGLPAHGSALMPHEKPVPLRRTPPRAPSKDTEPRNSKDAERRTAPVTIH